MQLYLQCLCCFQIAQRVKLKTCRQVGILAIYFASLATTRALFWKSLHNSRILPNDPCEPLFSIDSKLPLPSPTPERLFGISGVSVLNISVEKIKNGRYTVEPRYFELGYLEQPAISNCLCAPLSSNQPRLSRTLLRSEATLVKISQEVQSRHLLTRCTESLRNVLTCSRKRKQSQTDWTYCECRRRPGIC